MTAEATGPVPMREPQLRGQTVVLIGGSSGIGLETARLARAEGAEVILTGRDQGRLSAAAAQVGAQSTFAFDATDPERLGRFFAELPGPVDHVLSTAGGNYYARLADLDFVEAQRLLASFHSLISERASTRLDSWLEQCEHSGIGEFVRFAQGLRRDDAAVRTALRYPWSQGPVEGQINRLKLLKRQMYGRAGFALLKQRMLAQSTFPP